MKVNLRTSMSALMAVGLMATCHSGRGWSQSVTNQEEKGMKLGTFSISLSVKDIRASKAFYEKLDFEQIGGDLEQKWVILQNDTTTIGLFQDMFPKNILTFNPGWTDKQATLDSFRDVREIQTELKNRGLDFESEADPATTGPASFVVVDPDGNPILVDQHVAKPDS